MEYRKILYQGIVKLVPADIAEHLVISNQAKYAPAEKVDIVVSKTEVESKPKQDKKIENVLVENEISHNDKLIDETTNETESVVTETEVKTEPKKRGRQPKKQE